MSAEISEHIIGMPLELKPTDNGWQRLISPIAQTPLALEERIGRINRDQGQFDDGTWYLRGDPEQTIEMFAQTPAHKVVLNINTHENGGIYIVRYEFARYGMNVSDDSVRSDNGNPLFEEHQIAVFQDYQLPVSVSGFLKELRNDRTARVHLFQDNSIPQNSGLLVADRHTLRPVNSFEGTLTYKDIITMNVPVHDIGGVNSVRVNRGPGFGNGFVIWMGINNQALGMSELECLNGEGKLVRNFGAEIGNTDTLSIASNAAFSRFGINAFGEPARLALGLFQKVTDTIVNGR